MKNLGQVWKRWRFNHQVTSRAAWSAFIIFIFLFGKAIPLPYTNAKSLVLQNSTLNFAALATGGNLSQLSLFSMGLGPWMSGMIIVNLLTQAKGLDFDRMSEQRMDRISKGLTMALALVQAFVFVYSMKLTATGNYPKVAVGITLITGTFFCVWLSNINAQFGLGGIILIVLVNMIQSAAGTVVSGAEQLAGHSAWRMAMVVIGGVALLLLFAYLNVIMDRGEVRLPLVHILVDSRYSSHSYLPVKLTPAGGMPVMFGMALVTIPAYVCIFLEIFYPQNAALKWGAANLTFDKLPGAILYVVLLFSLSMAFAYINVDPDRQAKIMQRAGDYLVGTMPGTETARQIKKTILRCGLVGALYTTIWAGGPMLLIGLFPDRLSILMLPGYVMMVIGFSMQTVDQINILQIRHRYQPLLEEE